MKIIEGDLIKLTLEGHFDVIVHGCNCQCTMGAGIAKSIRYAFPKAYEADKETIIGSPEKLGSISSADIDLSGRLLTVVNAYTQFHWKGSGVKADYEAIRKCMRKIKERYYGKRIGYPQIGAGLAGGDWAVISAIITEELVGEDHCLVKYKP